MSIEASDCDEQHLQDLTSIEASDCDDQHLQDLTSIEASNCDEQHLQDPTSNTEQRLQDLTNAIREKMVEVAKTAESMYSASIYRVPAELRKLKESAYTPRLVSIGPLHSGDNHLKSYMQDIKKSYANSLICRVASAGGRPPPEQCQFEVLRECVSEMQKSKDAAKKYYAERVDALDEEMLVVDGCFILELLYRYYHIHKPKENQRKEPKSTNQFNNDPLFDSTLTQLTIQHDLFLLENQLPFFVLEKLFNLTVERILCHESLAKYIRSYFKNTMSLGLKSKINTKDQCAISFNGKDNYHILHFLHKENLPLLDPRSWEQHIKIINCASDLDFAGVKFVSGDEVKFTKVQGPFKLCSRDSFHIPTLRIYDSTEPFLRNLIALEQCCPGVPNYFTSYAFLMDTLVNSAKDVEVLSKAGVVVNFLGADEEASDFFNNLCKEIVLAGFYFAETCKRVDEYSKRCWPNALAHIKRRYFATPWAFIAMCVGFVAFVISVVKFVRSFYESSIF